MNLPRILLGFNVALALGAGLVWWHQRAALQDRQVELNAARAAAAQTAAVARTNARLRAELPTEAELDALRSDQQALPALRAEVAQLQARVEQRLHAPVQIPSTDASQPTVFVADQWFNAGRQTPLHTIMTALWAASRGNAAVLKESIQLNPQGPERLAAMWAELPAHLRERYPNQEQFLAGLSAQHLPIHSLQYLELGNEPEDAPFATVRVRVNSPEGEARFPTLITLRGADGWKLVLPTPVLESHYERLTQTP
jgi:hypothetical protein